MKIENSRECSRCRALWREYEDAAMTQVTMEAELFVALDTDDYDLFQSLNPEVDQAWRTRNSVRAAIRKHQLAHMN